MGKKKSAILEAVHETAKGLHEVGVMDQVTLREFDQLCLAPIEAMEHEDLIRLRLNLATPTLDKSG
jgi:putative transcriptional regulator